MARSTTPAPASAARGQTEREPGLLGILQAGDLNPALRALLPAAVVSALRHDPDPLLRLDLLSEGLIPNVPGKRPVESSESIDETLFVDTLLRGEALPVAALGAGAPARLSEAPRLAARPAERRLLPVRTQAPRWAPVSCRSARAGPTPPPPRPRPVVPPAERAHASILSGAQDLRTPDPAERPRRRGEPDSRARSCSIVPFTGHSVLGSDFSGCAERAVGAFFAGTPVQPCGPTPNIFSPTPVTPTKLAYIHPPSVLSGKAGQTLTAVLDTILDLNRQVIGATLQANTELPVGSSFGGLRGGYARLESSKVVLHQFAFVPGVRLSGAFPVKEGQLQTATIRISGSAAAPGTVRIGTSKTVSGTLGGRRFVVSVAKVKLARAGGGGGEWPAGKVAFLLPGLAHVR